MYFLSLKLIFNSSILGMNLFGCKFCEETFSQTLNKTLRSCDRQNFDSLLWATFTVFQVIIRKKQLQTDLSNTVIFETEL